MLVICCFSLIIKKKVDVSIIKIISKSFKVAKMQRDSCFHTCQESTIKITSKSSKAAKKPVSSHVLGNFEVPKT